MNRSPVLGSFMRSPFFSVMVSLLWSISSSAEYVVVQLEFFHLLLRDSAAILLFPAATIIYTLQISCLVSSAILMLNKFPGGNWGGFCGDNLLNTS